jgi:hypothetical protein
MDELEVEPESNELSADETELIVKSFFFFGLIALSVSGR